MSDERIAAIGAAFQAMRDLTAWERTYVLCWFCQDCYGYIPPGGGSHVCEFSS